MTAINCLVWPDHALLFTDGACNIDGEITWIGDKVRQFPHLGAVITCTGDAFGSIVSQDYIGGASTSFDDLVGSMAPSVEMALADYPTRGDQPNDFLAVGYSDRAQAFAAYQCSYAPGEKPVTKPVGRLYLQPGLPNIIAELKARGLDPDRLPGMTPNEAAEQLVQTMEVQRQLGGACVIGGFQQITILTRGEIITRIANHWPDDKVGKRLNLEGLAPLTGRRPLPGLGG